MRVAPAWSILPWSPSWICSPVLPVIRVLGRFCLVVATGYLDLGRGLLVDVALVQFDDVSLGIGDPCDPHPRDEHAHIERAERYLCVRSDRSELGVEIVDQKGHVPVAGRPGAVFPGGRSRPLLFGREELQ